MRISIVGGHKTFYPFFRDPEDFDNFESAQRFVEELAGMANSLYVCVQVEVDDFQFKYLWGGPLTIQQTWVQATTVLELRAPHVEVVFFNCQSKEGGTLIKGVREYASLSQEKLAFYCKPIIEMLTQIQDTTDPYKFHIRKDEEMWSNYMQLPERLIMLGVAIGWCQVTPGGQVEKLLSPDEEKTLPYLLMAKEAGFLPQLVEAYKAMTHPESTGEKMAEIFNSL